MLSVFIFACGILACVSGAAAVLTDEAGADRFPDIGEMRGPAAILIDRELDLAPRRELDEFAPVVEILDEWFLR